MDWGAVPGGAWLGDKWLDFTRQDSSRRSQSGAVSVQLLFMTPDVGGGGDSRATTTVFHSDIDLQLPILVDVACHRI